MRNEARKLRILEALVHIADRPTRTWVSSKSLWKPTEAGRRAVGTGELETAAQVGGQDD